MSRLLAWCAGATLGLVAGALLGDAVRTDAELRAARRTARRLGAAGASPGGLETPGAGNGPQNGAQRIPEQRSDVTEWPGDGPCTQRSPGGGLVCCQEGPHRAHLFLGTGGPDRKEDADTEVDA